MGGADGGNEGNASDEIALCFMLVFNLLMLAGRLASRKQAGAGAARSRCNRSINASVASRMSTGNRDVALSHRKTKH